MGGVLSIRQVTKTFGHVVAVDQVSLDVASGEFVTLLGPSGSGKTTTLQIVAGFVQPDAGSVSLDGRSLAGVPPYRRNVGMVFQHYALFPHMTVEQNVAFPLEARGAGRREITRRVAAALELVGLGGYQRRSPRQLSGGQQQRVALARAIVFQPPLLLMDEPLGALDKKLRERLQLEVMEISRGLGVTVLYVTHDQEEALVMSNRIAVYHAGRIEQVGTPAELYERPASAFVAGFVGESNMFSGVLQRTLEEAIVRADNLVIRTDDTTGAGVTPGARVTVVVRPERLRLFAHEGDIAGAVRRPATTISGRVREAIYLGATRKYIIALVDGHSAVSRVDMGGTRGHFAVGDPVTVAWDVADGVVVPAGESSADLPQDTVAQDADRDREQQMARLASGGSPT